MTDMGPEDVEKRALLAFLDAQRAIVLAIVAGLAQDALRTLVLPSDSAPTGWSSISDSPTVTDSPAGVVLGFYRGASASAPNAIVVPAPSSVPLAGTDRRQHSLALVRVSAGGQTARS